MTTGLQIGRYEVLRLLGTGGMAQVYLAQDTLMRRQVAVKLLSPQFAHNVRLRQRFLTEAQMVAGLENPYIVPVYDFGEYEERPFIVMRYMPHGTLADRIAKGPLSLHATAVILKRLCLALHDAHAQGIVHRDLKPSNVLFDQRDDSFLADFGIAKALEGGGMTTSGIIGTPAYMSPEQARGMDQIDGRSDIYSLGILIFEMLTGRQPYEADTPMAVALKHITEPPPRIEDVMPSLPPGLGPLITQVMAKEPADRFADTVDLADAFEGILTGSTSATVMRDMPPPAPRTQPRSEKPLSARVTPPPPLPIDSTDREFEAIPSNVLGGHSAPVLALATHPARLMWASGSADHRVLVWDGASRTVRHALTGHSGPVQALAFSPNGVLLASGGDDHSVRVWRSEYGNQEYALEGLPTIVTALAFSPDNQRLAVAGDDGTVYLFQAANGQRVGELRGHRDWVRDVTFSPSGALLASASGDQTVYLWDVASGQPVRALSGRGGTMWCAVFISEDQILTGSHRGLIQHWELATGRCMRTIQGPPTGVWSLAVVTETRFLTAGFDNNIREWDLAKGTIQQTYSGHTRWVRRLALTGKPGQFISASDDQTLRVWQLIE